MANCLQGLEECKFTQRMIFEILDDKGVVCDRTVHELNVPLSFNQAIAMKYIRMRNAVRDGIEEFLEGVRPGEMESPQVFSSQGDIVSSRVSTEVSDDLLKKVARGQ